VAALTGGAVLRAAAQIFAGLGEPPPRDPTSAREGEEEESRGGGRTPLVMVVPMAVLLAAALAAGLLPAVHEAAGTAAARMLDTAGYARTVLGGGARALRGRAPAVPSTAPTVEDLVSGAVAALGAVAVAALGLYRHRIGIARWTPPALRRPFHALRDLQSGDVRDYVAWLVLGAGVIGGVLLLGSLR
jgi:multicomponent Na+:H+ antiporter subunit D